MDGWRGTVATTSIFTAAAVTDWLDGYIARKVPTLNLSSLFVHLTLKPFSVFNLTHLLRPSFTCNADENEINIWCLFRSCS